MKQRALADAWARYCDGAVAGSRADGMMGLAPGAKTWRRCRGPRGAARPLVAVASQECLEGTLIGAPRKELTAFAVYWSAQHVSRRRLLLQSLARFGDQPRVLDADKRLRRECCKVRSAIGEKPNFPATDNDRTQNNSILAQCDAKPSANTPKIEPFPHFRALLILHSVACIRIWTNAHLP